jgi:DNA-binding LytR/AlgR family response regulator
MMTCIILDDEPLAVALLEKYVGRSEDLKLIKATTNVYEAIDAASTNKADLIFLDIQMPELTGVQVMKILNGKTKVILTTAFDEYAVQAFELDAVDYLLKPFSFERFTIAVNKVKERLSQTTAIEPDFIIIKSGHKMIKVLHKEILYLEAMRDYIAVHTLNEKILTLQSLRTFEDILPKKLFRRIHKSYIVNISCVTRKEKKKVFIEKAEIPVGESFAINLRDVWN